jgi:histidinol-phosphatase (PHP family)
MLNNASTVTTLIPIDYHMHSTNSYDCRAPMADMCRSALQKGVAEIAFTEHFNNKPEDLGCNKYDPERFFRDIEACRVEFEPMGLSIKAGVEVGEPHLFWNIVEPVLNSYPYDIVLGSLHWNNGDNIFERPYFQKRGNMNACAREYFAEMVDMVEVGGFNVLAHMDVFKRTGFQVFNQFDIREFEKYVRPVFAACIRQGIAPEINTSGLRLSVNQTHPTVDALRWYREMGGELLTIGSDSHRPEHIAHGFDIAMDMAREAGFTQVTRFAARKVAELVAM